MPYKLGNKVYKPRGAKTYGIPTSYDRIASVGEIGVDSAVRRAHTARDVSTLKARACRRGGAEISATSEKNYLGVSAKVYEERILLPVPRCAHKSKPRHYIRAYERRYVWECDYLADSVKSDILAADLPAFKKCGGVRADAYRRAVNAEEEMKHRGVTRRVHTRDIAKSVVSEKLGCHFAKLLYQALLKRHGAVFCAVVYSRDDVRAKASLGIFCGNDLYRPPLVQGYEREGERCSSDIKTQTEVFGRSVALLRSRNRNYLLFVG